MVQSMTPSTQWQEHIAPDEAERFEGYARIFTAIQERKSQRYGAGRTLHRKQVTGAQGSSGCRCREKEALDDQIEGRIRLIVHHDDHNAPLGKEREHRAIARLVAAMAVGQHASEVAYPLQPQPILVATSRWHLAQQPGAYDLPAEQEPTPRSQ